MVARAKPSKNGRKRDYKDGDLRSFFGSMENMDFMNNLGISRFSLAGYLEDYGKRNIYKECGYPSKHPNTISPENYRDMYDRNGVATRAVDIYPDECWALDPEVYESEDTQDITEFEEAWKQLTSDAKEDISAEEDAGRVNALHYLHRVDQISGIGRFGLLFFGTNVFRGGR